MHVNFRSLHEYSDFLYSEYEAGSSVGDAVDDRFLRGTRARDLFGDDLSLDDALVDLDEIG